MKWFELIIAGFLALGLGLTARANDFYVSQSGGGATNTLAWLNAATSWNNGVGTIQPGDTVHLVGIFTNGLAVGGSGIPSSPVKIYFEPNVKFSVPTLAANSYWLYLGSRSNIVIDGGQNGRIELTDNGTVVAHGGTHTYGNGGITAIYGAGNNNVTIQNLTIWNMYDRQTNTEAIQGMNDGQGILINAGSNITVSNCLVSGCMETFTMVYGNTAASNLLVTACTFSNFNHGITIGSGGVANPLYYNVTLTRNNIRTGDSFETKDGIGDLGFHRNPIFLFNESELAAGSGGATTGCISNIVIAGNFIKAGEHPQSSTAGTAGIFFDCYNPSATVRALVYNNIATVTYPLSYSSGMLGAFGAGCLFANNTMMGWTTNGPYYGGGYTFGVGGTNACAYNNISISGKASSISTVAATAGLANNSTTCARLLSGVASDYNIFNGINGYTGWINIIGTINNGGTFQEGFYDTLSQYQNMFGGLLASQIEPHSTTATVRLDANLAPLSADTVAIGRGTNLTLLAIALGIPDLTNDFAGNPRQATGNWTIGALGTPNLSPMPQVTLVASPSVVTNTSQTVTLQWSSANATNLALSGFGQVPLNGTTNVPPGHIAPSYTLTAFGINGTNSTSAVISMPPSGLRTLSGP